jgi:hypothetical protein
MFHIAGLILICCIKTILVFSQENIEFLGLQNKNVTSLSINFGIFAVGTNQNGVYWQTEYLPSDTSWIHIDLDS